MPRVHRNGRAQANCLLLAASRQPLSTIVGRWGILVVVHAIPPGRPIRRRTGLALNRMDNLSHNRYLEGRMPLEKIRDLLKGSLGRSLEALSDEDRLAMAWPVACGKAMAEHGTVAGFTNGILRVQVADGPWRRQLMSMQSQLAAETGRIAGVKVTGIHWEIKRTEPK